MVTHDKAGRGRVSRRRGVLGRRRLAGGFVLSVLLPAVVALLLSPLHHDVNLVSDMLLFLLVTVVVSLVGGVWPALVSAVLGSMLLNYFFTPPLHTLTISDANNALALAVFLAVAMLVSSVVTLAARRTREAARSAAEASTLADLSTVVFAEGGTPEEVLGRIMERVRETFALESVSLLSRRGDEWVAEASAGPPCRRPGDAETAVPAGEGRVLALSGHLLEADDQRLVEAFAAQVAILLDRIELRAEAAQAGMLAAGNRMRTALLAAVGHDLRTPLAAAKASVSSLRSSEIDLTPGDRSELLATAEESLDRLAGLVENLLDMSRLQAGALSLNLQPAGVDEVVARVLDDLGPDGRRVVVDLEDALGSVHTDPGLLERVLANLVTNALRYAPGDTPPRITAGRVGDRVEVRVVDRGPGIPQQQRDAVFQPFQRLGDRDNTTGIGLGLALSRGLAEAMGATLDADDTPGGGLTMVLSLPTTGDDRDVPQPGLRERSRELT